MYYKILSIEPLIYIELIATNYFLLPQLNQDYVETLSGTYTKCGRRNLSFDTYRLSFIGFSYFTSKIYYDMHVETRLLVNLTEKIH